MTVCSSAITLVFFVCHTLKPYGFDYLSYNLAHLSHFTYKLQDLSHRSSMELIHQAGMIYAKA